ncbi:MAG: hypothetical protein MJ070_09500 [Lachnospiraceae bacterium]|nr:hypothetical protein [Lachnospiraceae bacterium]
MSDTPSSFRSAYKVTVNVLFALFGILLSAAAISSCSEGNAEGKSPGAFFTAFVLLIALAAANEIRCGLLFLPDWKTSSLREKILHGAVLFFAVTAIAAASADSSSVACVFLLLITAALRLFLWITDLSEKNRKETEQKR